MKVVIILCLVALALADDDYQGYVPYGRDYSYYHPRPKYHKPYYHDHDGKGSVEYHYHVDYPKYWAHQGKWEKIDPSGTRGSYHVNEPNSHIYVKYDFPKHGRKW